MIRLLLLFISSTAFASYSPATVITDPVLNNQANVGNDGSLKVDNSSHTQPVSGSTGRTWTLGFSGDKVDATGSSVSVSNFPATITNFALETGGHLSSVDTKLSTINTTLGTPFQAGGSIGNTSFGISGTLPSFASTPTFNIGTTGGLALDSTLSAFSSKFGTIGQKTMAGSAAVVIASDQSTLPVSISGSVPVTGPLTDAQLRASAVPVSGTFFQATQPVSISGSVPVTGPLTDTQLRASAVPVSGTFSGSGNFTVVQPTGTNLHVVVDSAPTTAVTGTFFQATQPVSAASLPLPTGASTSALQTTGNSSLSSIDSKITAVNTGAVVVSSSALPTGASTSANQATEIASLSSIDTKLTSPLTTVVSDSSPATQTVTVQDTASTTTAIANGQNAITGTPTAGSAATFAISSKESVSVQVTGVWTGTIMNEVSFDGGVTYYSRGVHQVGSPYTVGSFTANFAGGLNTSGMTHFRVRATAAMTGTATVKIVSTANPNSVYIANGISLQDSTTATQKLSISAAGAAKVDGSAVTQPVSGTVTINAPVNTTGSGSAAGATVSTVQTLTAPANTVGFILMTLDTSTANVRWAVGRTATTTLGQQLQPGRSSDFVPIGANVSVVAESGTQNIDIQWISR